MRRTAKPKTPRQSSTDKQEYMVSLLNGAKCPTGGKPGNAGGGRPPSAVREACLRAFDERIPRLAMIADGSVAFTESCPQCGHKAETPPLPVTDVSDMIRATDALAKYGLGERSEFSEDVVAKNVDRMLQLAQSLMSDEDFAVYCRHTDGVWNGRGAGAWLPHESAYPDSRR